MSKENEWDMIATNYDLIFRPRFIEMYKAMANLVFKYQCETLFDFACGVGEPSKTILELASNDSKLQQIIAGDSSSRMLHIAQKINHPSIQFSTILLNDKFDFKNLPDLDCITCSLGLMYLEDVGNILDQFYVAMKGKGILIASVWPHYTKVPFLRILKQVNQKMGSGSVKEASYFENEDASFSFWRQSMVQELLLKHKFEITEWFEVDMPMQYQEPVQVVQFSSEVVEWFSKERENGVRYCTELIKNELGKDPIWPFTLQNKGVVFVAKCIL